MTNSGKDARNRSYWTIRRLGEKQHQVLNQLLTKNLSNAEIAAALNWPINRVTGRCKELRDAGLIEDKGKAYDIKTRRVVHLWGLVDNEDQRKLF